MVPLARPRGWHEHFTDFHFVKPHLAYNVYSVSEALSESASNRPPRLLRLLCVVLNVVSDWVSLSSLSSSRALCTEGTGERCEMRTVISSPSLCSTNGDEGLLERALAVAGTGVTEGGGGGEDVTDRIAGGGDTAGVMGRNGGGGGGCVCLSFVLPGSGVGAQPATDAARSAICSLRKRSNGFTNGTSGGVGRATKCDTGAVDVV